MESLNNLPTSVSPGTVEDASEIGRSIGGPSLHRTSTVIPAERHVDSKFLALEPFLSECLPVLRPHLPVLTQGGRMN